jgi:hypothetical protein
VQDLVDMLAAAIIVGFALYFISSGVAFVAMHKLGPRFPTRLVSAIYSPLEAIGHRSKAFGDFYTHFQWWMYQKFVDDFQSPTPPPPTILK